MPITTRPAALSDAPAMCAIINEIIAIGGTTAHEEPFSEEYMRDHYINDPLLIHCTLAEIDGVPVGFQAIWHTDPAYDGPKPLPRDWAVIGSFVKVGMTGHGIGKALFAMTRDAAKAAAIPAIDATIRADNASGLGFYSGMGFADYDLVKDVPLKDGTPVDRVRKVYRLGAD